MAWAERHVCSLKYGMVSFITYLVMSQDLVISYQLRFRPIWSSPQTNIARIMKKTLI